MELRLLTINLRFENDQDRGRTWERRKWLVRDLIGDTRPDVVGTQEGRPRQLSFLDMYLKDYRVLMPGRHLDPFSQYPTLLIRKEIGIRGRGEFWLSKTPEVHLSKDWDSAFPRMLSYARISLGNGASLIVAVTHLDNKGHQARIMQARLIRDWSLAQDTSLILMGDFNEGPEGNVHRIFCEEAGFWDTWKEMGYEDGPESYTYHGFTGTGIVARMDWILVKALNMKIAVKEAGLLRVTRDGLTPSDHFPYFVRLNCEFVHSQ